MRDLLSTVYRMNRSFILSSITYVLYFFCYVISSVLMNLLFYLGNHALDFINCNDEMVNFIDIICKVMGALVAVIISIFTTIQLMQKVVKDMIKLISEIKKDIIKLTRKKMYLYDLGNLDEKREEMTKEIIKDFENIEIITETKDSEEMMEKKR